MKKLVTSYTFTAASKTIQSADFTSLDKILLITNVTDNVVIYQFNKPSLGGTLAGTTLTLVYDTTTMSNSDNLQIFVDDAAGTAALDSTLTGGTQKSIIRGGAKGTTAAADVTSTASGANNQTLDTGVFDANGNRMPSMDAAARAGFHKLTDGVNTAAVKAASTAAVATDPAVVVSVSPNNTIPVNNTQVNGNAMLAGNGAAGTGAQRITIASDNSPVAGLGAGATGSAQPANAVLTGMTGAGSNLQSLRSVGNAGNSASGVDFWAAVAPGLFNGTNADMMRGNVNTTTGDTGTKTTSFAGATQTNYNARGAYITVLCGTVSGTTPTLSAQLQMSYDGGTTWINVGSASSTISSTGQSIMILVYPTNTSSAAGGTPGNLSFATSTQQVVNAPLPRTWRLNYSIGGTTPSFAITGVYVNYIL